MLANPLVKAVESQSEPLKSRMSADLTGRSKAKALKPAMRPSRKKGFAPDAPQPRLSIHKKRSIWFQSRTCWPFREARVHRTGKRAKRGAQTLPVTHTVWESIGPTNIGGRMTSIVCHPDKADWIWDGRSRWRRLEEQKCRQNLVSSLAFPGKFKRGFSCDRLKNPEVIYCGTGEANLSFDSYAGVGIYRTTDGGDTWVLLAPSRQAGIPTRIGAIAIDPHDCKHLLIGGVGAA